MGERKKREKQTRRREPKEVHTASRQIGTLKMKYYWKRIKKKKKKRNERRGGEM